MDGGVYEDTPASCLPGTWADARSYERLERQSERRARERGDYKELLNHVAGRECVSEN